MQLWNGPKWLLMSFVFLLVSCTHFRSEQIEITQALPSPTPLQTVVMTQGTNMAATLSPDEKYLALALQGVLWILPSSGGAATPITPPELDAHEPAWSPDGSEIVFYAFAQNGFSIWKVDADGSDLEQIIKVPGDARYPSYSADGRMIVYASDEEAEGYQAWAYNIETSKRTLLTTVDESGYIAPAAPYFSGAGNVVSPTLSPDGNKLAFVLDGEMDALIVRSLEDASHFTVAYAASTLGAPAWSKDGLNLYIAGLNGEEGHVAKITLGTDEPSVTKIVSGGDVFPFRPSVKANGGVIYTADGSIFDTSLDAQSTKTPVPFTATVELDRAPYDRRKYDLSDPAPQYALGIVDPVLSPDGTMAAFTAIGDLWIVDLPNGVPEKLTDDPFVDLSPSWSPDGQKIAFVSDRGGKSDIWTLTLDTLEMVQITDSAKPVSAPDWSPDGSKIAYLSDALLTVFTVATVNTIDIPTRNVEVISTPIFGPSAPEWSPDGSKIALVERYAFTNRFREGINAIHLLPASGDSDPVWVYPVPGKSLGRRQWNRLAWAEDGTIVYRMDGGLWSVHLSSDGTFGEPTLIAETGENPSWSSDGTSIIYADGARLKKYDATTQETSVLNVKPIWSQYKPDDQLTVRVTHLFDGTGDDYLTDVDIHIINGTITSIHPIGAEPIFGTLIDATGKTAIPGLIESHTHQSTNLGMALGETWLSHGITTVRETGDDPYHAVERREAIASGRRPGPRVFTAGPLNEGARVSYGVSETAGTIEQSQLAMRLSDDLQLDMFKSYVRQDYDTQKAVIALAHASGIPVSSHELYPAVANGIDNMEHLSATSRRGYSLKQSRTGRAYQDVVSLIVESGVVVTPTLTLETRRGTRDVTNQKNTLREIVEAGGKIVAGTDSPFVPFAESLHTEIAAYVDAGISESRALRSATSDAADALGVGDQLGRIVPGALADMVILDGDPLSDISATRSISIVIQNGIIVFTSEDGGSR